MRPARGAAGHVVLRVALAVSLVLAAPQIECNEDAGGEGTDE
jgi:hypothetical protein